MPTLQELMLHAVQLEDRVALLEWLDQQLRSLTENRTEIRLGTRTVGTASIFTLMAELEERRVALKKELENLWAVSVPVKGKERADDVEKKAKTTGGAGARGQG